VTQRQPRPTTILRLTQPRLVQFEPLYSHYIWTLQVPIIILHKSTFMIIADIHSIAIEPPTNLHTTTDYSLTPVVQT